MSDAPFTPEQEAAVAAGVGRELALRVMSEALAALGDTVRDRLPACYKTHGGALQPDRARAVAAVLEQAADGIGASLGDWAAALKSAADNAQVRG